MANQNLFAGLPFEGAEERFEELGRLGAARFERIVSFGQASPLGFWYDQPWHEWVLVLRGRAGLEIEGTDGVIELGPGDFAELPAHRRHRVAWTA
ncbi:MAG: cupin domain-containing protein, partial [Thermoanaerobaculia bacterium]|nr:cupin domain-containing protein [Thermoanaerobaculia bacterium]